MKQLIIYLFLVFLFGCVTNPTGLVTLVSNAEELNDALSEAKPGDEIVMADGTWENIEIRVTGKGTESQPIVLRAENPGEVFIEGRSDLKLGGSYLIVEGLYFRNGSTPSSAVIEFRIEENNVAFNSVVRDCVIEGYNQAQRNISDLWVRFWGRNNQLDQCYLAGKSNRGPTIRIDLEGNENANNYHKITRNHFGPRPPKGGPSAETIQLGNSSTSMVPSYTLVADNLFEYCNGEVEVISSKSNFNEFRNNVFYKSEGSLVTRHGNYCTINGNYFIGEPGSDRIGGVRLIGSGHWVTNNYFYSLRGKEFRSPLAVMNGIPRSPLNRYIQVTDVVIAYNSWINCESPWHFGVGSNVDQRDVLPASEIRSERPIRTTVANNLIYGDEGDSIPVVAHDLLDGIKFSSNVISNTKVAMELEGISEREIVLTELGEDIYIPEGPIQDPEPYYGFEFDRIQTDLFGQSRDETNSVGASITPPPADPEIMNFAKYGASWFNPGGVSAQGTTVLVESGVELQEVISKANEGDIIQLAAGEYDLNSPLAIDKLLTIQSADEENKVTINYKGSPGTPSFEMNPGGRLTLKNINLIGNGDQYAFASLKENMSSLYNLTLENCEISNFDYLLKAHKYSFSEYIIFRSSRFSNCKNGIELSEETEDRGEYNAENIIIENCDFSNIQKNVIDYYRGGYDESTVGGNLVVSGSSFVNCGASEENGVMLNTYGIINVNITGNSFENNDVEYVAVLWGAKNNTHANNTVTNSGEILVEQNLKLKTMY